MKGEECLKGARGWCGIENWSKQGKTKADHDDDDDDDEEEEEEDWEEDEDTYSICICTGMAFRYTKTEKCNFLSNPCN